jgi:2'-5' RNA ligase
MIITSISVILLMIIRMRYVLFHLLSLTSMSSKVRPNYFIGFKLTHPEFVHVIKDVQAAMLSTHPHLGKCITSADKLHITSVVMGLKNTDELSAAISCFKDCQPRILEAIGSLGPFHINFGKISSFGSKVLFLEPLSDESSTIMRVIHRLFEESFLNHEPKLSIDRKGELDEWIPHATIMKTSADKRNGRRLSIPKDDFLINEDRIQMSVPVVSIDLLSMTEKDASGYYKSYASIEFDADHARKVDL